MITINKSDDKFYIKIFSTTTPEFNAILLVLKTKGVKYEPGKGSTHSNPKILLDIIDELDDNFDTFVSDTVRREIEEYNPYTVIKPCRIKIDESFFEKFPPKGQYQIDDIKKMTQYGRILNACKMGLGKTYETIQTINQLFIKKLSDRVLIITISSTLYNWKHELLEFSDLFSDEDILIVTEKNRDVFYTKKIPKIVICSYNTFRLCSDFCYKQKNKTLKAYKKAQIDFSFWGTSRILICDEIHFIKNIKTRWTQIIHYEKQYFDYRYGLSATPSPNGVQELYSLIKFLDDQLVDKDYIDFLRSIGTVGTKFSNYALASIDEEKAKQFYSRVNPYLIRRFLRDHIDLPQVHRKNIYIELAGIQKRIYQAVVNDSLTAIKNEKGNITYRDIQIKFPYILQSLSDPLLIQDKIIDQKDLLTFTFDDNVKVQTLDLLLTDLFIEDNKRKIIIWAIHPATINRLVDRYKKYKPIAIHGSNTPKGEEKDKWRHNQVEFFKKSDNQLLIANPSVLGTGVNISFANAIIHYDRDFNYTTNEQSDGRMERIGLNEEAYIYYLIVANSLEIHLEKSLENKKMIDEVFLSTGNLTINKVKDIFNPK